MIRIKIILYYCCIISITILILYGCSKNTNLEDIYSAIKKNDLNSVKKIIKNEPNILLNQHKNFDYPIYYAIQLKSTKIIKYLLQFEINYHLISLDGTDIFQYSDTFANLDVIKLLFETNRKVNQKILENAKSKLLLSSTYGNRVQLASYLIKKGANVNYQDPVYGNTALILCGFYGSYDVAKLLLKNGANKDIKNKEGYTAFDFAKKFGHENVAKLIQNFKK